MTETTVVITTLAMYQTQSWALVGENLKRAGIDCVFLSYDDRSTEFLRARNFEVHAPALPSKSARVTDAEFAALLNSYDMRQGNFWLNHERITFEIRDSQALRARFAAYLTHAHGVLAGLVKEGRRPVLVQEVGGFLCVAACFFAARRAGIDNWFIEPSFFRGRLFFTKNSFNAPQPPTRNTTCGEEVRAYLAKTLESRQIVVPVKDRHQYSAAVKKIANVKNVKRLVEKVFDKYVLGKHQEFGHIGQYARMHARMLRNNVQLRGQYQTLKEVGRFVYYPLHVPGDMALTLRAPQWLDQLGLIDYLARTIPFTHKLLVKEHPAMIGAIDVARIKGLLRRYDNLGILDPRTNNYDVLGKADVVVSVNSKSGAEALLVGTPVVVLGDAFYRRPELVSTVEKIDEIGPSIESLLDRRTTPARQQVDAFFQDVWDVSWPGELFVATEENGATFARSILGAVVNRA